MIFFSKYGHVAYQIKWNEMCDNKHANTIPLHRPLTTGVGSKGQISCFAESGGVAYQIKRNEVYSMPAKILPLNTLLTPGMRSNGQNSFFF